MEKGKTARNLVGAEAEGFCRREKVFWSCSAGALQLKRRVPEEDLVRG